MPPSRSRSAERQRHLPGERGVVGLELVDLDDQFVRDQAGEAGRGRCRCASSSCPAGRPPRTSASRGTPPSSRSSTALVMPSGNRHRPIASGSVERRGRPPAAAPAADALTRVVLTARSPRGARTPRRSGCRRRRRPARPGRAAARSGRPCTGAVAPSASSRATSAGMSSVSMSTCQRGGVPSPVRWISTCQPSANEPSEAQSASVRRARPGGRWRRPRSRCRRRGAPAAGPAAGSTGGCDAACAARPRTGGQAPRARPLRSAR